MSTRPNLGGLFNGNTPPARSSGVADALRPRLVPLEIDEPIAEPAKAASTTTPGTSRVSTPEWLDPIKALGSYFDLLQTLLDANRKLAEDWLGAVLAMPQKAGLRRG